MRAFRLGDDRRPGTRRLGWQRAGRQRCGGAPIAASPRDPRPPACPSFSKAVYRIHGARPPSARPADRRPDSYGGRRAEHSTALRRRGRCRVPRGRPSPRHPAPRQRQWQPPGGVLELAETFEEGVQREVLEETGISVAVERLTGVYKNLPVGIVALVFRCRPTAGSAQPSDEAAAVRWLTLDEVVELMDPAHAVRITDALQEAPTSRAHDGARVLTV